MDQRGIHGISHWTRVHENALYLAKHVDADVQVVQVFAFLHDCCREFEGSDPDHGQRAADFAEAISEFLYLDEKALTLLYDACAGHEKGRTTNEPTIGVCWDSDRLDLGRVGRKPNRRFLSTERAKKVSVINWAYQRSRGHQAKLKA